MLYRRSPAPHSHSPLRLAIRSIDSNKVSTIVPVVWVSSPTGQMTVGGIVGPEDFFIVKDLSVLTIVGAIASPRYMLVIPRIVAVVMVAVWGIPVARGDTGTVVGGRCCDCRIGSHERRKGKGTSEGKETDAEFCEHVCREGLVLCGDDRRWKSERPLALYIFRSPRNAHTQTTQTHSVRRH